MTEFTFSACLKWEVGKGQRSFNPFSLGQSYPKDQKELTEAPYILTVMDQGTG